MPYLKLTKVSADKLIPTMPIYEPLVEALTTSQVPEERLVPVSDLLIEPEFRAPEWILNLFLGRFAQFHLEKEEFMHNILVMERSDGSLWVYDDQAFVEAAQRVRPSLRVHCHVYRDRTK